MGSGIDKFLGRWHAYFLANSLNPGNIPWGPVDYMPADERRRISASVAAFQLGEYSEGKGLLKLAAEYAGRVGSGELTDITRLFIREEQNHALLLKRFMGSQGIEPLKSHWTDWVFRKLRKALDFELSLTVLVTAEIISLVYYDALHKCTGSKVLKAICEKILADEAAHVSYESELILHIRGSRPRLLGCAENLFHRFLFSGTVLVVYSGHRRVLRGGGYSFGRFWRSCSAEFSNCFAQRRAVYKLGHIR